MRVYITRIYSQTIKLEDPILISFKREDRDDTLFVRTLVGQSVLAAANIFKMHELIGEFTGTYVFHPETIGDYLESDEWTPHVLADGDVSRWEDISDALEPDVSARGPFWPSVFTDITKHHKQVVTQPSVL